MTTLLAVLSLGALVYFLWNVVALPFSAAKRRRRALKAGLSFVCFFGLILFFGTMDDRDAQRSGFLSSADKASAQKAGVSDPAIWAQRREAELFKQRQEEAIARDAQNARKREDALVAAREAERLEKEKQAKQAAEDEKAAAAKAVERDNCKKDIKCWGEQAVVTGTYACTQLVERMAKYDFEWTDGILDPKFGRYRWRNPKVGTVTLIGDKIKMQNGFGAWSHMIYECDYDPTTESIADVRVRAGRL